MIQTGNMVYVLGYTVEVTPSPLVGEGRGEGESLFSPKATLFPLPWRERAG